MENKASVSIITMCYNSKKTIRDTHIIGYKLELQKYRIYNFRWEID